MVRTFTLASMAVVHCKISMEAIGGAMDMIAMVSRIAQISGRPASNTNEGMRFG